MQKKKIFLFSLLFLNILNVLDGFFTHYLILKFGFVYEQNIIVKFLIMNFGWFIAYLIKTITFILLSLFSYGVIKKTKNSFIISVYTTVIYILCVFILWININHLYYIIWF